MKKAGLRRIIFMGAVGIYDEIPADMDDEDNVRNNPDQIPNRKAADIVENSGLDYTVLRPGYLRDGDKDDFTLTFKGEQAKGYVSTIPSVVGLAVRLIHDDTLYVRQSVSITRDMSDTENFDSLWKYVLKMKWHLLRVRLAVSVMPPHGCLPKPVRRLSWPIWIVG